MLRPARQERIYFQNNYSSSSCSSPLCLNSKSKRTLWSSFSASIANTQYYDIHQLVFSGAALACLSRDTPYG